MTTTNNEPAGIDLTPIDAECQEILRPILSRKGMQRYLNGDPIELDPSDYRAIIGRAIQFALARSAAHAAQDARQSVNPAADERALFEAHLRTEGRSADRNEHGIYTFNESAWQAWQARAALAQQAASPAPTAQAVDATSAADDNKYDLQHVRLASIAASPAPETAQADDENVEADAYMHACDLMEQFQRERAKRGVEIGTQGSLCDGIAWLFARLNKLESAHAQQGAAPRERECTFCTWVGTPESCQPGLRCRYCNSDTKPSAATGKAAADNAVGHKPEAWLVPKLLTFEGARTSCPPELVPQLEGTVAWQAALFSDGDIDSVTDKHGVKHAPVPLYADRTPATSAADAKDAERWRWIPAVAEDYQINLLQLYRDVDAAIAASQKGTEA